MDKNMTLQQGIEQFHAKNMKYFSVDIHPTNERGQGLFRIITRQYKLRFENVLEADELAKKIVGESECYSINELD